MPLSKWYCQKVLQTDFWEDDFTYRQYYNYTKNDETFPKSNTVWNKGLKIYWKRNCTIQAKVCRFFVKTISRKKIFRLNAMKRLCNDFTEFFVFVRNFSWTEFFREIVLTSFFHTLHNFVCIVQNVR